MFNIPKPTHLIILFFIPFCFMTMDYDYKCGTAFNALAAAAQNLGKPNFSTSTLFYSQTLFTFDYLFWFAL